MFMKRRFFPLIWVVLVVIPMLLGGCGSDA